MTTLIPNLRHSKIHKNAALITHRIGALQSCNELIKLLVMCEKETRRVHAEDKDVRDIMHEMTDAVCDDGGDGCLLAMKRSVKMMLSSVLEAILKDERP